MSQRTRHFILLSVIWFLGGLSPAIFAIQGAEPLRSFQAISQLPMDSVSSGQPVDIKATTLYCDSEWGVLFVSEDTNGWYLSLANREAPGLQPGQRVRIVGATRFADGWVQVVPEKLIPGEMHELFEPRKLPVSALFSPALANAWVETQGQVRWVEAHGSKQVLEIADRQRAVRVVVQAPAGTFDTQWLDARVRVRGVCTVEWNASREATAVQLFVSSASQVERLADAGPSAFSQTILPIRQLLEANPVQWQGGPVHIQGRSKGASGAGGFIVQDSTGEIRIATGQNWDFPDGTVVDAVGWPSMSDGQRLLRNAALRRVLLALDSDASKNLMTGPSPEAARRSFTSIEEVRSLSDAEALLGHDVQLEAVVTFVLRDWNSLFVQDGTGGIYVDSGSLMPNLSVGDRVGISATTSEGHLAPIIKNPEIRVLGRAELPQASFYQQSWLMSGHADSLWIEMQGVVQSVTNKWGVAYLTARDRSGEFAVVCPETDLPDGLVHSQVRFQGVCVSEVDGFRRLKGIQLYVPGARFMEVAVPALEDPFASPEFKRADFGLNPSEAGFIDRVRLKGVVTVPKSSDAFYLKDGREGMLVLAEGGILVRPKDVVEVVGYPERAGFGMVLKDALVRVSGEKDAIEPLPLNDGYVLDPELQDLPVTVEAQLLNRSKRNGKHVLMLQNHGWVYEAICPEFELVKDSLRDGSRIRLTGIYDLEADEYGRPHTFRIYFASLDQVHVLEEPPWWTPRHTTFLITGLLLVLLALGWRTWVMMQTKGRLMREVAERRRTESLLAHEQMLLQALMHNSPDHIYFKDCDSRFIRVNRAIAMKFKFEDPKNLEGLTDFDLFEESVARQFREDEEFVIRSGSPIIDKEEMELTKDGREHWVSTTTMPYYDKDGALLGVIGVSRDITQRKQAETELRRQKLEYETIFNSMPAVVLYKDASSRILRANQFAAELFGYSQQDLVGRSYEILVEETGKDSAAADRRILETGQSELGVEEVVRDRRGVIHWLLADKLPHRDTSGKIIGTAMFAVDITQRKQAELALQGAHDHLERKVAERTASLKQEVEERERVERQVRDKEAFIRNIIDADPNLIFVKSRDGRFTMANQAMADFHGKAVEEIIGLRCEDHICEPEVVHAIQSADDCVWQTGEPLFIAEEKIVSRQGRTRWFQTFKRPLFDQDGEMTHLLAIATDITERKMREEEHERTRAFLNSVVENLPITVFIKEAEELRFVLWNKAGEELTGYCNEELVGKNDYDFFPREEAEHFIANDRKALESGKLLDVPEEVLKTRHRGERIMHTRKIPIPDESGRPRFLLGIAEDITERRQAEIELRKAKEDAEAANRAKSEFLATMSHEIRTPMNGVIGMTHLLLDTELSPVQRDYAETVQTSAESLLTIINDILDFSKIEAGKLHFENLDFDLREVVDSCMDMLSTRAEERSLEFESFIPESVNGLLRGDPGRLRQVLLNLMGNAIKFTHEGSVTLEVSTVSESPYLAAIRFEIRDTGIGISEAARDRIFKPFSQADSSTTRQFGGTGLGLVICQKLVQMMNGEIGFDSRPNSGSTFWFVVRLEKQIEKDMPKSKPAQSSPGPSNFVNAPVGGDRPVAKPGDGPSEIRDRQLLRVLVAEDNLVNQKVAVRTLEKLGYSADCAANGLEVLTALEYICYDVILMDCNMPEMDGYEATRRIRSKNTPSHPLIIAMTANAMVGDREKCLEAGMNHYITKPVRAPELEAALALARKQMDMNPTMTHTAMQPERLNLDTIQRLRDLSDGTDDPAAELIELYLEDARNTLSRIVKQAEDNQLDELRKTAHTLKGSSRNIGADLLASHCSDLEQEAAAGNAGRIDELVAAIRNEFEQAVPLLEKERCPA